MVAAMYKIRTDLFQFMNSELEEMWRAAIEPSSNEIPAEKYFLDRDKKYEFLSQLWHREISLTDYCFHIAEEGDSHMSDYGLHAAAAFFQVTIIDSLFLQAKSRQYMMVTSIMRPG